MSETSIKTARKRQGAVLAHLTWAERDIAKLEVKSELASSDQRKIKRLLDQVKEDDKEFEQWHLKVLDFMDEEDQDSLEAEESICDEHGNRVMELLERLEQLEVAEESVSSETASDPLQKLTRRLQYLGQEKDTIIASTRSLPSELESHTRLRLQKCQEDISALNAQLSGLVGEILSSMGGNTSALMDNVTSIKRDVSNQDFEVRRLLLEIECGHKPAEAHKESIIELPRISTPTFDGDILNWVAFWEQFEVAIHSNERLHDAQKFVYLREAVKDGPAKQVIQGISLRSEVTKKQWNVFVKGRTDCVPSTRAT